MKKLPLAYILKSLQGLTHACVSWSIPLLHNLPSLCCRKTTWGKTVKSLGKNARSLNFIPYVNSFQTCSSWQNTFSFNQILHITPIYVYKTCKSRYVLVEARSRGPFQPLIQNSSLRPNGSVGLGRDIIWFSSFSYIALPGLTCHRSTCLSYFVLTQDYFYSEHFLNFISQITISVSRYDLLHYFALHIYTYMYNFLILTIIF